MLIELKWMDTNTVIGYKTEIYRSDMPFDSIADATLIATVDSGINTYLDTDVVLGQKYYYRFRNKKGNSVSNNSRLFEFEATMYTGPGPQRTVFGDEHFGYYGKFPRDILACPTINHVRAVLGLPLVSDEINQATFHKFAVGGTVRGTFSAPLAIGSEVSRDGPLNIMMQGGSISLKMGLHSWEVILPSVSHSDNPEHVVAHFPGELRSMLGVITEMYSRVEDATTGNKTGDRLIPQTGQSLFYKPLEDRYPGIDVQWICSSDWAGDSAKAINWTASEVVFPQQPKELHIDDVDYSVPDNWEKTLIWPVIVYTSLIGPKQ